MTQHQRIYSIISIVQRRCILGPAFPCFTSHHLDVANIAFIIICFHGWGWLKIDTFLSYETSKTVDLEMTLLESHCLLSSSLPFWFVSLRTACWPNGRVVRSISRVQVAPSIERNGFRLALPYFDLSLSDPFWVSINYVKSGHVRSRFHHSSFFRANLSYQRWLHVHNDRMATGYSFVTQKVPAFPSVAETAGFRQQEGKRQRHRRSGNDARTQRRSKIELAKARMTIVTTVGKDNA